MPAPSNTLYNFRQTNSVRIDNIPDHASKSEITALFNTLIGPVCSSPNIKNAAKNTMEITFSNRDAAIRALRMSGYVIAGSPITNGPYSVVTAIQDPSASRGKRSADGRRNLYVLGLPFALTQTEFSNIFSCFGTVSHCVILATVDNSSRRRGFVVMSTHDEAERAMSALTRTQIKFTLPPRGCTLDISWAVVQRSQGFLDGGDRTMALDPHLPSDTPGENVELNSSNSSIDPPELEPGSLTPVIFPNPTLVIKNLPTLIFSEIQDLHPLLCPYGPIKKLELVSQPHQTCATVIVEYSSVEIAVEAKESLQGQSYAGYEIEAQYIRTPPPPLDANWNVNRGRPLNALAPPFFHTSHKFIPGPACSDMFHETRNVQVPDDRTSPHRQGQLAAPPFSFHIHRPHDLSIGRYTKGPDDLAFNPIRNVCSPPYLDSPYNAQDHYLYAW
ncbi:hypothetical protein BD779DRAFT_1469686 [Infundibulicybe gibba]|nr:hypothetical protein BD779DRAFT_1469686 [Infundibulicybe gibba]